MSSAPSENRFLLGLLVGVGIGLAVAVVAGRRRRLRRDADTFDEARSEAGRRASRASERRTERAGRDLMKRVDGIRSAGM